MSIDWKCDNCTRTLEDRKNFFLLQNTAMQQINILTERLQHFKNLIKALGFNPDTLTIDEIKQLKKEF